MAFGTRSDFCIMWRVGHRQPGVCASGRNVNRLVSRRSTSRGVKDGCSGLRADGRRRNSERFGEISGEGMDEACATGERGWETIGRKDHRRPARSTTEERTEEHGRLVV